MSRGVVLALVAVVLILGFIGGAPIPSRALSQEPAATPTECAGDGFDADVRPPNPNDAAVTPVFVEATPGATPTIVEDDRELYLVVVTLKPGECIGFDAFSNQKDGAVVWMVQQGKVEFIWRELEVIPGLPPTITRGDLAGNHVDLSGMPESEQTLYPGDWVTQNRMVAVSFRNVGSDSAIILKAVYAKSWGDLNGCGGDCR
jgi:hypothetical protein